MLSIIDNLLIWSEVWALIIPLLFIFPVSKQQNYLKPVGYYIIIALFLNVAANIISNQKTLAISLPWHNNILIYNLHSLIRFVCFTCFFILLKQNHFLKLKRIIPFLYIAILLLNFAILDRFFNPMHINGNLMTTESYLLLIYCLLFYLSKLKEEGNIMKNEPDFWIVTGLALYVVINFCVFLFYIPLFNENAALADRMWVVHNVAYICLCLFIAKGFSCGKNNTASIG